MAPRTLNGKAQHLRPAQQAAMDKIKQYVSWFLKNDHKSEVDWAAKLKRVRLDCRGEEVKMPHCLTWDSIEPALPKRGQVGLLRATDICEGWLGEVMRDPHKALLPRDPMASRPPNSQSLGRDGHRMGKHCSQLRRATTLGFHNSG